MSGKFLIASTIRWTIVVGTRYQNRNSLLTNIIIACCLWASSFRVHILSVVHVCLSISRTDTNHTVPDQRPLKCSNFESGPNTFTRDYFWLVRLTHFWEPTAKLETPLYHDGLPKSMFWIRARWKQRRRLTLPSSVKHTTFFSPLVPQGGQVRLGNGHFIPS